MNRSKSSKQIPKQAIIIASISLVAAAMLVPSFAEHVEPEAQTDINEVIASHGSTTTVMIMGTEDAGFVPQLVRIQAGDSVKFINVNGNNGGLAHAVVSIDGLSGVPDGNFSGYLPNVGDTYSVKFSETGIYYYVDSVYPEMRGTIVVI